MNEEELSSALNEAQARFGALFEHAPVGVFLFDRELRLHAQNPRFVRMLRSSKEALRGLDLKGLRDNRVLPAIEAALRGDLGTYEGPYEATTGDAKIEISLRVSPLRDGHGQVIGGMGLVEDVTAQVEARQALERSEARFRTVIEHSPDTIAVFQSGKFVYANPAMVATMGHGAQEELLGAGMLSVVHPADVPLMRERRDRILAGLSNPPAEIRLLRRDGSVATVEIASMALEFDGAPSVLAVGRDISDRKELQAKLLQADRMASVGTLAAGVAHEINNPLAYVKANLDSLATRKLAELAARIDALPAESTAAKEEVRHIGALLEEVNEMVRLAREGADQVRTIVADLRTFSRPDDAPTSWVDINRVLDAALHIAWSEIRGRATVSKSYDRLPDVQANESRLAQLFLNVLLNAAHAMPEGKRGEIHIATKAGPAGDAVIVVHDNGEGMTPKVLARIFDPFFTTKPAGLGTGLGLWICQGIVTALNGRIEVASEPGTGTTFTIVLPTHRTPVPAAT